MVKFVHIIVFCVSIVRFVDLDITVLFSLLDAGSIEPLRDVVAAALRIDSSPFICLLLLHYDSAFSLALYYRPTEFIQAV